MLPLTIQMNEDRYRKLQELAEKAHTTPEELAQARLEEWLENPADPFDQAARAVLRKNAELYRRLA